MIWLGYHNLSLALFRPTYFSSEGHSNWLVKFTEKIIRGGLAGSTSAGLGDLPGGGIEILIPECSEMLVTAGALAHLQ